MKLIVFCIIVSASVCAMAADLQPKETQQKSVRVWVHLESTVDAWKVRAIQGTVEQFISGFERMVLVSNLEHKDLNCEIGELKCQLRALGQRNIQIAITGQFDGEELELSSYETWTYSPVRSAEIDFSDNMTLTQLRHRIFLLVQPFVEVGGLLDQMEATRPIKQNGTTVRDSSRILNVLDFSFGVLLGLALLLPIYIVRKAAKKFRVPLVRRPPHRRFIYFSAIAVPLIWWTSELWGSEAISTIEESIPAARFLVGGVTWAALILLVQRLALPPIGMLEKATFVQVPLILRAWFNVAILKIATLFLALLPFFGPPILFGFILQWDPLSTWAFTVPFCVAVGVLWYAFWIAELTLFLDAYLAYGRPDHSNPWAFEVNKYFRGYVNRLGIAINESLCGDALFLPTKYDHNYTYGGGLLSPRVMVSSWTLPYAMGPLSDAVPGEDVGFIDYQKGTLFPRRRKKSQSEFELSMFFLKRWYRKFFVRHQAHQDEFLSRGGKNFNLHGATIMGYVMPLNPDVAVPLIANNREDFEVVAELLTEHYSSFSSAQDEHELDDTDPTDKDFLFGGLMREFVVIENRDHLLLTIFHALDVFSKKFPARLKKLYLRLKELYQRHFSRFPVFIIDAYTSLNHSRNHLIQFLHYSTGKKSGLTARADSGQLYAVSKQILAENQTERLQRLGSVFFGNLEMKPVRANRYWQSAVAATAFVIVGGLWLLDSVIYHDIYTDRMRHLKEKIQRQAQAAEKDHGGNKQ